MQMLYLILLFFRVLKSPAGQSSMPSLPEKLLSCDNPHSSERITGRGAALCKYCSHEHQPLHAVSCTRTAGGRDVDLDFHFKITFEVCLPMGFSPAVWSAIKQKGQVD